MYPFIRMAHQIWRHRNDPPLPMTGTHESRHICWPWDIDPWVELNNGRTLTLYDLGRIPMSQRIGLVPVLRREGWGVAVAGVSVRYRRRIRAFQKFTMQSRTTCWDDKFSYMEQSMWLSNGECASHSLVRGAVTSKNGIVPPAVLAEKMGVDPVSPPMPDWIKDWVKAEAERPWPPMQDGA